MILLKEKDVGLQNATVEERKNITLSYWFANPPV